MTTDEHCPDCGTIAAGYIEQGTYDGVIAWVCHSCSLARPRFTGDDPLSDKSRAIAAHLTRRTA